MRRETQRVPNDDERVHWIPSEGIRIPNGEEVLLLNVGGSDEILRISDDDEVLLRDEVLRISDDEEVLLHDEVLRISDDEEILLQKAIHRIADEVRRISDEEILLQKAIHRIADVEEVLLLTVGSDKVLQISDDDEVLLRDEVLRISDDEVLLHDEVLRISDDEEILLPIGDSSDRRC